MAAALSLLSVDMGDSGAWYDTDSDSTPSQPEEAKLRLGKDFLSTSPSSPEDGWKIGAEIQRSVLLSQPRNLKSIAPPPKEPAPLFIEPLPPSMKVPTPLVSAGLNPFIPAKKRLSFAEELGASPTFQQFISLEPAVIRASDLATVRGQA
ncbi:unnamed protein product [Effrenium voratum]|nr:unnamed protein product [Effrenium voratum]|mmetsp:Transcript_98443/g.234367  ORF Transcript_98443/g.234367 Transcript_98443/m.234367 type:complete len:150 (-) Transcript_98443:508-957(-)